jgi:hypothetical protein
VCRDSEVRSRTSYLTDAQLVNGSTFGEEFCGADTLVRLWFDFDLRWKSKIGRSRPIRCLRVALQFAPQMRMGITI